MFFVLVTWFKGVTELTQSKDVKIYSDDSGNDILEFTSARHPADSGKYDIEATNPFGSAHVTFSVKVVPSDEK